MKAKVINESSNYFDMVISVKLAGPSHIFGYIPNTRTRVQLPYEDVELTFEHEWEKSIVKYKSLLNIKLPMAASMKLYAAICYVAEQHFNGEIRSISVVKDVEEKVRKGYWYKYIDIIINHVNPVNIRVTGKNYTDLYNINAEDIDAKSFAAECVDGICRLKELIGKSNEKLKFIEKMLYQMDNLPINTGKYRAIEGK
jgi:hypothetical protein